LIPRNKKLWVFIGWHRSLDGEILADNTKYLYLYTHHSLPQIKAVWLAKSKVLAEKLRKQGMSAYYQNSIRGIWHALRAGYTILDAYLQPENFMWMGKTKFVQLMHGRGMKKGGYSHPQLRHQDFIFPSSSFVKSLLGEKFIGKANIFITGYPRSDVLAHPIDDSEIDLDTDAFNQAKEFGSKGVKRILYAPTFRRGVKEFELPIVIDFKKIVPWLKQNNAHLFVSLHPKYRNQEKGISSDFVTFIRESDIYPLLSNLDIFITDYSSLFADIALLNKPMVFYPFDFEDYVRHEGIEFDYNEYTPGPKAFSFDELLTVLEKIIAHDEWIPDRQKIAKLYHAYHDGNASKRISEILLKDMGLSSQ